MIIELGRVTEATKQIEQAPLAETVAPFKKRF
jgi:hypothetical protein